MKGKKVCPECDTFNGPRAFNCKKCGHAFKLRKPRKRKRKELIEDYTSLEKGDTIYVVGGSGTYYTSDNGEKQYLTDRGEYKVYSLKQDGILAYSNTGGYNYLYMGKTMKSKLLDNITKAPCRILKKNCVK